MNKYKFFINPAFDPACPGGCLEGDDVYAWLQSKAAPMSDALPGEKDFAALSQRLLLEGAKDLLIWDDLLKAAEMTYFAELTPLQGPSIDFCCGYGFWTGRILGKIDLGVDLFPEDGPYRRTIEGFRDHDFIGGAYRSVLQADVTEELPVPDNFFQSVVSVCSLEHIERADRVLATMARIVKPGGKVFLSLQTNRYIETFAKIFHPDYVGWVRENFCMHRDRAWRDWEELVLGAGFRITGRRFVLPTREAALKALAYWEEPFAPVLGDLGLERAVKEIPQFRAHYYDLVRRWSAGLAAPDDACIVCLTCEKKI